jgi:hypothetical protein
VELGIVIQIKEVRSPVGTSSWWDANFGICVAPDGSPAWAIMIRIYNFGDYDVRSEHMNLPKGYKPSIAKQGGLRPGLISVGSKVATTHAGRYRNSLSLLVLNVEVLLVGFSMLHPARSSLLPRSNDRQTT